MTKLKIDFISDVVCPWCAIGLNALEKAIETLGDTVSADFRFHPFELNPDLPKQGQDVFENIARKYGSTRQQVLANQENIRLRGEEVGFTFDMPKRTHYYNTFDAHRLLHWAAAFGRQRQLKHALLKAYFTEGRNVSDHDVLAEVAGSVGLDSEEARTVLASNQHADDVRDSQFRYRQMGIQSVPSVIINDQYLITGGQPVAAFERALRDILNG